MNLRKFNMRDFKMHSRKALSELVALVLIIIIVTVTIGVAMLWIVPTLNIMYDQARIKSARNFFNSLEYDAHTVILSGYGSSTVTSSYFDKGIIYLSLDRITTYVALEIGTESSFEWWDPSWHFRILVKVTAGTYDLENEPISVCINFTKLLTESAVHGVFDENSVRVVEYESDGSIVGEVVSQFDKTHTFDPESNAVGVVSWLVNIPASSFRYYGIYFDLTENGYKSPPAYSSPDPEFSLSYTPIEVSFSNYYLQGSFVSSGGILATLIWKNTGLLMTSVTSRGFFEDRIRDPVGNDLTGGNLLSKSYDIEVLYDGPIRKVFKLKATYDNWIIEKTILIHAYSKRIYSRYNLTWIGDSDIQAHPDITSTPGNWPSRIYWDSNDRSLSSIYCNYIHVEDEPIVIEYRKGGSREGFAIVWQPFPTLVPEVFHVSNGVYDSLEWGNNDGESTNNVLFSKGFSLLWNFTYVIDEDSPGNQLTEARKILDPAQITMYNLETIENGIVSVFTPLFSLGLDIICFKMTVSFKANYSSLTSGCERLLCGGSEAVALNETQFEYMFMIQLVPRIVFSFLKSGSTLQVNVRTINMQPMYRSLGGGPGYIIVQLKNLGSSIKIGSESFTQVYFVRLRCLYNSVVDVEEYDDVTGVNTVNWLASVVKMGVDIKIS